MNQWAVKWEWRDLPGQEEPNWKACDVHDTRAEAEVQAAYLLSLTLNPGEEMKSNIEPADHSTPRGRWNRERNSHGETWWRYSP